MAIRTQQSISGFIASDPQLTQTAKGSPRFYARVGQEHFRREDDGTITRLEPTFHNLVAFRATAERAHERFTKGDSFVAEGYVRPYTSDRDGQSVDRGVCRQEDRPRSCPHHLRSRPHPANRGHR